MPADPTKREPNLIAPNVGELAEWLNGYDGIVSIETKGESPTRLRVEFATEERAAQFISTVPLIDGITISAAGNCTL